ncbi:MAG: transcriptional regulator [Candidatus Riflebacteria bacterium HGW-Riflebacteria-2]|jgi:predicted DNA-binding transcriptional regulator AlpA|nr:MAG: transcriptional regulator [Candidatus Riflebacteria bacterium HGW-Riflebacteria-2]
MAIALPETGFLRLKQILVFIPVCKAAFYKEMKAGRYPKPVKQGRSSLWRVEDIKALINQMGTSSGK